MFNILKLNKIDKNAETILADGYNMTEECANPDGIILRSFKMHDYECAETVMGIARAGAGVNNIPLDKYKQEGIVVFNTPGANANAVKELVLCGLFLSSRKVAESISWAKSLKGKGADVPPMVEKGKSQFAGQEISGKTLGIIGLGAIGANVAKAAIALGMKIVGYDPFLPANAVNYKCDKVEELKDLYAKADYITIHSPLNDATREMINKETIAQMKDDVKIINCARGELVNNADIKEALKSGKVGKYVTDFPCDDVIEVENIIAIPHLGASTKEAEINCAVMAANQLKEYLEVGNIINSVNYPNVKLNKTGVGRIVILSESGTRAMMDAPDILSAEGYAITGMINASKGDSSVMLIDVDKELDNSIIEKLSVIKGIRRIRLI